MRSYRGKLTAQMCHSTKKENIVGLMTLSIVIFSIITFSTTTFSITTFNITTFSIAIKMWRSAQ